MTPEDFQRLYQLQIVDARIAECQKTIAHVDDGTDAGAELEADQATLAELEEQLRQKQSRHRKLELDLEGVEAEKKEKSDRAYGGTISNPKELAALEQKIDELDRNVHRHEDMILEVLEEMEELEGRTNKQREKSEAQSAAHKSIVENFEHTTAEAREEIADLEEAREELVAELPQQLLRPYEELRRRESGTAVALLRGGSCSECNLAVPRAKLGMIKRGVSIIKCEHCRRILVVPGE